MGTVGRIVCINGAWCYDTHNPAWRHLGPALARHFGTSQIRIESDHGCHPWEVARLRRLAEKILAKYDDGTKMLLAGHSMGGLVACAIADRFQRSEIIGVVTIFSPHDMFAGTFTKALKARDVSAPIVSFSANFDELVWWGARHPSAIKHIRLNSNHLTDLIFESRIAEAIAREARLALSEHHSRRKEHAPA